MRPNASLNSVFKATRVSRGFTLTELLIVVAIIGILSAIALPSFRDYQRKANQSAVKAFLEDIVGRQEQYAAKNMASAERLAGSTAYNVYGKFDGSHNDLNLSYPPEVQGKYTVVVAATSLTFTTSAGVTVSIPAFTATAVPVAGGGMENTGEFQINQFGLRLKCPNGCSSSPKVRW